MLLILAYFVLIYSSISALTVLKYKGTTDKKYIYTISFNFYNEDKIKILISNEITNIIYKYEDKFSKVNSLLNAQWFLFINNESNFEIFEYTNIATNLNYILLEFNNPYKFELKFDIYSKNNYKKEEYINSSSSSTYNNKKKLKILDDFDINKFELNTIESKITNYKLNDVSSYMKKALNNNKTLFNYKIIIGHFKYKYHINNKRLYQAKHNNVDFNDNTNFKNNIETCMHNYIVDNTDLTSKSSIFKNINSLELINYINVNLKNKLINSLVNNSKVYIDNKKHKYKLKIDNLYNAYINGDKASDFHFYCDNKGPNLVIIQDENNNIFGGFTSLSWNSSGKSKQDRHAFLYSINKQIILNVNNIDNAIYDNLKMGPVFGHGNDIRIFSSALSNKYNSSTLKKSYGTSVEEIDQHYFTNSLYFKIKNYEVLSVGLIEINI